MWKTTFKVSPSSGLSLFEDSLPNIAVVSPILAQVLRLLSDTAGSSLLSVYANDFTLINMHYAPNNISLGYVEHAPDIVQQDAGLAFTFALKPVGARKKFKYPDSQSRISRGRGMYVWGSTRTTLCTVLISRSELSKMQALALLEPTLRAVYNVVGAATRNLFKVSGGVAVPEETQPSYFHMIQRGVPAVGSFGELVDKVAVKDWIYCPKFWSDYGYLFTGNLPRHFPLYWALFLDDNVYRFKIDAVARSALEAAYADYLAPAFGYLQGALKLGVVPMTPPPELVALVVRIRASQGVPVEEDRYSEFERYVSMYMLRLIQGASKNPAVRNEILTALSRVPNNEAARCVVGGLIAANNDLITAVQLIEAMVTNESG